MGRAFVALALMAALAGCSGTTSAPATVTVTKPAYIPPTSAAEQPTRNTIPGSGTYRIGVDVQPGTYSSTPTTGSSFALCQWTRLKDLSGTPASTIALGNTAAGPIYVTIEPSDVAFNSFGCETWQKIG